MPERHPPDDPREWINRALSNLSIAQIKGTDVYLEDLCFNAQQAAEKSLKAVLLHARVEFPYIHDLATLLTLIERSGTNVPQAVKRSERLTRFAVATRYPGLGPSVTESEYYEALADAERVVEWAQSRIESVQGH